MLYLNFKGVLGISVKIQLPHDPSGREGVSTKLPDVVTVREPKHYDTADSNKSIQPFAQNFGPQSTQQHTQQQQNESAQQAAQQQ